MRIKRIKGARSFDEGEGVVSYKKQQFSQLCFPLPQAGEDKEKLLELCISASFGAENQGLTDQLR